MFNDKLLVENFTPLMEAVQKGDFVQVNELLKKGAQLNEHTSDGNCVLHLAISGHHVNFFNYLMTRHAWTIDSSIRFNNQSIWQHAMAELEKSPQDADKLKAIIATIEDKCRFSMKLLDPNYHNKFDFQELPRTVQENSQLQIEPEKAKLQVYAWWNCCAPVVRIIEDCFKPKEPKLD